MHVWSSCEAISPWLRGHEEQLHIMIMLVQEDSAAI